MKRRTAVLVIAALLGIILGGCGPRGVKPTKGGVIVIKGSVPSVIERQPTTKGIRSPIAKITATLTRLPSGKLVDTKETVPVGGTFSFQFPEVAPAEYCLRIDAHDEDGNIPYSAGDGISILVESGKTSVCEVVLHPTNCSIVINVDLSPLIGVGHSYFGTIKASFDRFDSIFAPMTLYLQYDPTTYQASGTIANVYSNSGPYTVQVTVYDSNDFLLWASEHLVTNVYPGERTIVDLVATPPSTPGNIIMPGADFMMIPEAPTSLTVFWETAYPDPENVYPDPGLRISWAPSADQKDIEDSLGVTIRYQICYREKGTSRFDMIRPHENPWYIPDIDTAWNGRTIEFAVVAAYTMSVGPVTYYTYSPASKIVEYSFPVQ